ncbi:unnamed protein product [Discosporangium mesarthrocarpum]
MLLQATKNPKPNSNPIPLISTVNTPLLFFSPPLSSIYMFHLSLSLSLSLPCIMPPQSCSIKQAPSEGSHLFTFVPHPSSAFQPPEERLHKVITLVAEKAVAVLGFETFLKMLHGQDPLFRFISPGHQLHRYYLTVKDRILTASLGGQEAEAAAAASVKPAPAEDPGTLKACLLFHSS